MRILKVMLSACLALTLGLPLLAVTTGDDARKLMPWLDIPAGWSGGVAEGVATIVPGDLLPGAALLLLVEPPAKSSETLEAAYAQALRDLGPWTPAGEPVTQRFDTGWAFRLGTGVTQLQGRSWIAQTAVALREGQRIRFWVLADSEATFNRYKNPVGVAISSAQDSSRPAAAIHTGPEPAPAVPAVALNPAFGQGVSGAYLGLERGARASAGAGGQQLVLDLAANYIGIGNAPGSPQLQVSLADYLEVDVFFPDGTYRRGLPIRGLDGDLAWERRQQPIRWGTWKREGDQIITRRGSYTVVYTMQGDRLISHRDRPWRKLPLIKDVRLEGTFARADFRDPDAPRLVLRADGTYEDRGSFLRMVGSAWHLVVPDGDTMVSRWSDAQARRIMGGGSGTYQFRNNTLTFRDRDGRIWQINAYLPPDSQPPAARFLVINGYTLTRD
jgi:hypothetical protein